MADDGRSTYEELGGRWAQVAGREREEAGEPASLPAVERQTWTRGQGHRTTEVGGGALCVVCGEEAAVMPDEPCPGPSGVAL